jgi:hypothetical protein
MRGPLRPRSKCRRGIVDPSADQDAQRNVADARVARCILVESRSFLRRA